MIYYSANYINSDNNFVIQNLPKDTIKQSHYIPTLYVLKNILQRGKPTYPSSFLMDKFNFNDIFHSQYIPLIGQKTPDWSQLTIKGNDEGYFPALEFYNDLNNLFPEHPFIKQLILPECNISINNTYDVESITKSKVEFTGNQEVDFYLPQAKLIIEIDGYQHDKPEDIECDKLRDDYLTKAGNKVIRIKTIDWRAKNEIFKTKISKISSQINSELDLNPLCLKNINNQFGKEYPKHIELVGIIRLQLYIIDLLISGVLSLEDEFWNINIHYEDIKFDADLAIEDVFKWLEKLLVIRDINFDKPSVKIKTVDLIDELLENETSVSVSILNKYSEEHLKFTNKSIHVIRTSYIEKTTKEGGLIDDYDYFNLSITQPITYQIEQINDETNEDNILWLVNNIFFGKNKIPSFNEGQYEIIKKIVSNVNTVGILPTGSGKSLCFHLATILQPAISFVVCPIISLMNDQESELNDFGISRIAAINSELTPNQKSIKLSQFEQGKLFLCFVSPERFLDQNFRDKLNNNLGTKICYAVIDEVHCLSEWGHDFRTSYLILIDSIKKHCPNSIFIGLTATASYNVLTDIKISLEVKEENIVRPYKFQRKELNFHVIDSSINKENILLDTLEKINTNEQVFEKSEDGIFEKSGVIFTQFAGSNRSILGCHELSTKINSHFNIKSLSYAAKAPKINTVKYNKTEIQSGFKANLHPLIVATKAFGMGVNKKNIHYTIHYSIPTSMESLYQEAGRAGRDKKYFKDKQANCYILFSPENNDKDLQNKIWDPNIQKDEFIELSRTITKDLSYNLFFLQNNTIQLENEKIILKRIINRVAKAPNDNIVISSGEVSRLVSPTNDKYGEFEKNIYRLYTMNIITDWTVKYSGGGRVYSIMRGTIDKVNILNALNYHIKKYDFEFEIESNTPGDKIIEIYLNWINNKFVYSRKMSLKNVYESCKKVLDHKIDGNQFKKIIESYFSYDKKLKALDHVIADPDNHELWFNFFYEKDDRNRTFSNSSEFRFNAVLRLNRILESFDITPLNLISGLTRLSTNEFENIDGKKRLERALKSIYQYPKDKQEKILDQCFKLLTTFNDDQKYMFCESLLLVYKYDSILFDTLLIKLPNENLEVLWYDQIKNRLNKINKLIHD